MCSGRLADSTVQYGFAAMLAPAANLHTLVDIESHIAHGVQPSLNLENVEFLVETVPSLKKVVSGRRVWVPVRSPPILSETID